MLVLAAASIWFRMSCAETLPETSRTAVNQAWFDSSVRPQDDLFLAATGKAQKPNSATNENALKKRAPGPNRVVRLLESAAASDAPQGTVEQRLGDFYASYMDDTRVNTLGMQPLAPTFERIDVASTPEDVATLFGYLTSVGISMPFHIDIHQHETDPSRYGLYIVAGGMTLDAAAYLGNDSKSIAAHQRLTDYVTRLFALCDDSKAKEHAVGVADFERALARASDSATHRNLPSYALSAIAPAFDWNAFFEASGTRRGLGTLEYFPAQIANISALLAQTPTETVRHYLRYRYVDARAQYLAAPFAQAYYEFHESIPSRRKVGPRELRAFEAAQTYLLDDVTRAYADAYLPPAHRAAMQTMFREIRQAFESRISAASWMAPSTRDHALERVRSMTAILGTRERTGPSIDYAGLQIDRDQLFANIERAARFQYNLTLRNLDLPFNPHDGHDLLFGGGYYDTRYNYIFISPTVADFEGSGAEPDHASQYARLGFMIGHEIAHAFSSTPTALDETRLPARGWSAADIRRHTLWSDALVQQYSAHSPLPGYFVDGKRTLEENIADQLGLDAAYLAYTTHHTRDAESVIDGMSGKQRFYYAFAQSKGAPIDRETLIYKIERDVHAPGETIVNIVARNQPGFYEAFGVKQADHMYLPPGRRAGLWF